MVETKPGQKGLKHFPVFNAETARNQLLTHSNSLSNILPLHPQNYVEVVKL